MIVVAELGRFLVRLGRHRPCIRCWQALQRTPGREAWGLGGGHRGVMLPRSAATCLTLVTSELRSGCLPCSL